MRIGVAVGVVGELGRGGCRSKCGRAELGMEVDLELGVVGSRDGG